MKFEMETRKGQVYDLTDQVQKLVADSKVEHGLANLFAPHATGILFIGEGEPNINSDYIKLLKKLAPERGGWAHDQIDNNAHAHLRSALVGASICIPVRDNQLALGTWQKLLFVEADGDRHRRFMVTVVSAHA